MNNLLNILFSENRMIISYINSKLGLDIIFIDPSDNTLYVTNDNGGSQNNNPNNTNNDIDQPMNNSPASPVNIENLPERARRSRYVIDSDTEDSDYSDGVASDKEIIAEHSEAEEDDRALRDYRQAKRAKIEVEDPEFEESAHIYKKTKTRKNDLRGVIENDVDSLNNAVSNMREKLNSAKIVERMKDSANYDNSSKKRTFDMMDETDTVKEAHFSDEKTKNEFLNNLSAAKTHQENLKKHTAEYHRLKERINQARIRAEIKNPNSRPVSRDSSNNGDGNS